jgi:RNase P subunit RPR2
MVADDLPVSVGIRHLPHKARVTMTMPARQCPRCQTVLVPGALHTTIEGEGIAGIPVKGSNRVRWEGDGGPYRVTAYRCPSCGAVEFAATERPGS